MYFRKNNVRTNVKFKFCYKNQSIRPSKYQLIIRLGVTDNDVLMQFQAICPGL